MPRNSKEKADDRALKLLAECVAEFTKARPAPRSAEDDAILQRLNAAKNDVRFARAFARVFDLGDSTTLNRMIGAGKIQDGTRDSRAADRTTLKKARAAIPSVIQAVKKIGIWDYVYGFTDAQGTSSPSGRGD